MRIVAGTAKGARLKAPAKGTRPTSEMVREALFGRLHHRGYVEGARVLDLYTGSGALGLESASRGAESAVLVDAAREAAKTARDNAMTTGLSQVSVVEARAEQYVKGRPVDPFDLVFIDPPYGYPNAYIAEVLIRLAQPGWLADDGLVVIERSKRDDEPILPEQWIIDDHRNYGETALWFVGPGPQNR